MSPKAMMILSACGVGVYLLFGLWINQVGMTKGLLTLAYLHYGQGLNTGALMTIIEYLPIVGIALIVIGWFRQKTG